MAPDGESTAADDASGQHCLPPVLSAARRILAAVVQGLCRLAAIAVILRWIGRKPLAGVAGRRIARRVWVRFHEGNQLAEGDRFRLGQKTGFRDFAFLGGFRSDHFKGAADENHGRDGIWIRESNDGLGNQNFMLWFMRGRPFRKRGFLIRMVPKCPHFMLPFRVTLTRCVT